jgi:hypothetical protein
MTDQHPITPPPELVDQWVIEACPECRLTYDEFTGESVESLATKAARWGADQELEACCHEVQNMYSGGSRLRDRRRPKPLSLKEQALAKLAELESDEPGYENDLEVLRRALEALPND